MASRRRSSTRYSTYGSVAYAPAYDGAAVRAPRREDDVQVAPRPRVRRRPQEMELTRTQVQVREAGAVSPFAVVGFLLVGVFAAMLIFSYAQLAALNDQIITARQSVTALQTEQATLAAQYERVFDMERIQAAVGDTMVRPTGDQVVYLDLSAPDTVTVYGESGTGGVAGVFTGIRDVALDIIEYFR